MKHVKTIIILSFPFLNNRKKAKCYPLAPIEVKILFDCFLYEKLLSKILLTNSDFGKKVNIQMG